MPRKADPRGKDRPRTIVLAGDVAEIAQKLADRGDLSATLSELLRHNYGFGDRIEEKKRELSATIDQKKAIEAREAELIAVIDEMEVMELERSTTVRPQIEKRREILLERLAKTEHRRSRAFDVNEITRLDGVIREINLLIVACDAELEALN